MNDDLRSVAARLDDLIGGMPGVTSVFAADPALLRSIKQLTTGAESIPLTTVQQDGDTVRITISVGVAGDDQAPATAAAIADAVRSTIPWTDAEVLVRVSRIVG